MSSSKRLLLAVDPSLTASGWAIFEIHSSRLLAVGVISPPGTPEFLAKRLSSLQLAVTSLFEKFSLGKNDFLVCEGPAPLVKNPQSALKVEGVRGIFETIARGQGLLVPGRVNPRTVQSEILGMKGKQLERKVVKEWSRHAAYRLYEKPLRTLFEVKEEALPKISQDIVDALLIGTLALSRIQVCLKTRSSIESAFSSPATSRRGLGGARRSSGWTEKDYKSRFSES